MFLRRNILIHPFYIYASSLVISAFALPSSEYSRSVHQPTYPPTLFVTLTR